jgi:hypothetical protein
MTVSIESKIAVMQVAYRGIDADMNCYKDLASEALRNGRMDAFDDMVSRIDILSSIKSSMALILLGKVSGLDSAVAVGSAMEAYFTCIKTNKFKVLDTAKEASLREGVATALMQLLDESRALSVSSIDSAKAKAEQAKAETERTRAEARAANARADIAEMDKDTESRTQESRLREAERKSHGWWWQLFHQ